MNISYVPSFGLSQPSPIFPIPDNRPGLPPSATILGLMNNLQQPATPQLQQAAIAQQQLSTTTTTHQATRGSALPTDIVGVVPVAQEDERNPNKTFEVLGEIKPASSHAPSIPTTFVAVNPSLTSTFKVAGNATDVTVTPSWISKLTSSRTAWKRTSSNYEDLMGLVSDKQSLLVNEIRVYDRPPIVRWLFLVGGIFLLVLGILTAVWCRPSDQFYYCRIWAAIAFIVFAIGGYVHGGDYLTKWKNILFIIFGMVTSSMTLACLCFVMKIFCHRIIEISQFSSWWAYLDEVKWRMIYLNDMPLNNLSTSGQAFPGDNEIACVTIDGVEFVVDILSFLIIISTTLVVDKFYNSYHVINYLVRPFDTPCFFNPYGQVLVGEVQIFVGFLLQCVVYGNENNTWQTILAPVFSGILPIIAGILTALTIKSCGINSNSWDFASVILEIASLVVTGITIVLVTIGLIENVKTFSSTTMTQTTFSRNLMIFSVFAFSAADVICLISFIYSFALIIRILICLCCPRHRDEQKLKSAHHNEAFNEGMDYREVKRLLLKLSSGDDIVGK